MCLILFAWQAHPDYPLVVAANRDEWRDRPTAPAAWWDDAPDILAGRDLEAGGTWLGVTRAGRFAAITNFRDPSDRKSTAPSRGQLVADFLRGDDAPRDYLAALAAKAARYNGFNLLLADDKSMCYFGSREGEIIDVAPGIHGLSNHLLDEPWPKVKMESRLWARRLRQKCLKARSWSGVSIFCRIQCVRLMPRCRTRASVSNGSACCRRR